jgi:von Willebrand factor type A domain/Aerotolerance regulator N-terminal
MNWGSFQALSHVWLVSLLAPLVLFYFLKLKRPRAEIPSLALWRQVLQDQRVNSPFQRFKRNLLLLLQILLLSFLILAALQPYWRAGPAKLHRLPVLLDCSASMGALDKPGGISRLAEAKRRVREMIDGLAADRQLCLISFDSTPRKRTGFTNNKRLLRDALDQIEVADAPSDLEQALRLVQALGRSEPFDEVLLFSDGNLPPRVNFDLSFKLNYQRLTPAGPNFGITALSAQRAVAGGWDTFVQIEGSADAEGNATVELVQDGKAAASERVTLARGRTQRMLFQIKGSRATSLRVQLTPDGFDSLAADNTAYLDLPEARPLRVFVPQSLPSYRLALRGIEDIRLFPQDTDDETTGGFDLVMSDRPRDLDIAARTRLSVGFIPPELQRFIELGTNGSAVVDWRRDAPVLQHVQLADLVVLDQPRFAGNAGEGDLENLGYEVLIHGQRGPLLVRKQDSDGVRFALLFHTDRSTLPYRVGFPIFVANVVQAALEQAGLAEARADRTGVLPPLTLAPGHRYEVQGPEQRVEQVAADDRGMVAGVRASRVGYYTILENGAQRRRVGACLLSPGESSLAGVEQIQFNERLEVAAATASVKTDRPLWPPLVMGALGVMLVEWWFYQKKPGGWK